MPQELSLFFVRALDSEGSCDDEAREGTQASLTGSLQGALLRV